MKTSSSRFAVLAAAFTMLACAGDDTTTESKPDAANNVDVGGDGLVPDSTKPDSPTDGNEASVDSTLDVTADSSADTTDATEAEADGARCPVGKWFDTEMGSCADCSETPRTLTCADFVSAGAGCSSTTSTMTLVINVDIMQIVSASVTYVVVHADGSSSTFTTDATVGADSFSFVATVSAGDTSVYVSSLVVVDACGVTSTPSIDASVGASGDAGLDTFHVGCPA